LAELKIIGQQGPTRFLVDAGKVADGEPNAGLPAARVYDVVTDFLGEPTAIGAITAHSPGWDEPTAPDELLETVRERVAALLPAA